MSEIIVVCHSCEQKNRIADPYKVGKWSCATCGATLLHKMSRPGDKIIRKCKVELASCLTDIQRMKGIFGNSRKLEEIRHTVDNCKARIEGWKEHLSYGSNSQEREIANQYHAKDLIELSGLFSDIENQIESKDWLKKFVAHSNVARGIIVTIASVASLAGEIMWLCGIPNGLSTFASAVDRRLLTNQ